MRRPRWISLQALDYAAGVALLILGVLATRAAEDPQGPMWLNYAVSALPALAVCVRRRWPVATYAVFFVVIAVQSVWLLGPDDVVSGFFGLLFMPYGVGAWTDRSAWWLSVGLAAMCVVNLTSDSMVLGDFIFPGGFIAGSFMAGRTVRTRTRLTAELHEAAVLAEEAHARATEEALSEERRRIAREMHDIVAHSVSVMVVQAGGARRILGRDPERAAEAAEQIQRIGRETLGEMRRLLGLGHRDAGGAARAPQPGLADLEGLVRRARDAGLPVELAIHGDRRVLPTGLDLTAYRIVQEALTNAVKHAGGAPTEVALRYGDDELGIRVTNGPPPPAVAGAEAIQGGGHGLVGMRERARAFGGAAHAGPTPEGGFEVLARLPLVGEDERAGHALAAEAVA